MRWYNYEVLNNTAVVFILTSAETPQLTIYVTYNISLGWKSQFLLLQATLKIYQRYMFSFADNFKTSNDYYDQYILQMVWFNFETLPICMHNMSFFDMCQHLNRRAATRYQRHTIL